MMGLKVESVGVASREWKRRRARERLLLWA